VLKKVCRQLGVFKWPYKETKLIARRQGRVIATSAPIPADFRNINPQISCTSNQAKQASPAASKRKSSAATKETAAAVGRTQGKRAVGAKKDSAELSADRPRVSASSRRAPRSGKYGAHEDAAENASEFDPQDVAELDVEDDGEHVEHQMSEHIQGDDGEEADPLLAGDEEDCDMLAVEEEECDDHEQGGDDLGCYVESEVVGVGEDEGGVAGIWRESNLADCDTNDSTAAAQEAPPCSLDVTGSDREPLDDLENEQDLQIQQHKIPSYEHVYDARWMSSFGAMPRGADKFGHEVLCDMRYGSPAPFLGMHASGSMRQVFPLLLLFRFFFGTIVTFEADWHLPHLRAHRWHFPHLRAHR